MTTLSLRNKLWLSNFGIPEPDAAMLHNKTTRFTREDPVRLGSTCPLMIYLISRFVHALLFEIMQIEEEHYGELSVCRVDGLRLVHQKALKSYGS